MTFSYNIQHCFICRPSDSTVPTDAGIDLYKYSRGLFKHSHGLCLPPHRDSASTPTTSANNLTASEIFLMASFNHSHGLCNHSHGLYLPFYRDSAINLMASIVTLTVSPISLTASRNTFKTSTIILKASSSTLKPQSHSFLALYWNQHALSRPLKAGLWIRIRIRIGSVFNRVCGSGSVFGIRIRIRIQEGKNDPQK